MSIIKDIQFYLPFLCKYDNVNPSIIFIQIWRNEMRISAILLTICLCIPAYAQSRQGKGFNDFSSRPVGELNAIKLKFEMGPVNLLRTDFIGIGHYYNRIGIGLELARYMEVMNNGTKLPLGTAMWEWLPIRISYIHYFVRGKYRGGDWEFMENRPFFIWNSITPYEYAKTYIRFYVETSYRQVVRHSKSYPFVLTSGVQANYGLLSIESGYRFQAHRWKGLVNRIENADPTGFTLTGPFISANISISAILTRTEIKKSK
jgi:hypothetical protein